MRHDVESWNVSMNVYEHITPLSLDFKEFGIRKAETCHAFQVTVENLFTHSTS